MQTTIPQLYEHYLASSGVTTDTRKVQANQLFFALKGANFDGNVYAEKAIEKGAAFAVIDNPDYQKDNRYLLVADGLTALQDLAQYHRKQLKTPILAITGSNGKTTTKELVKAVLATTYRTQATKGNFNNHIGVPLTLLAIRPDTEIAVVEMGANHQHEINQLCGIALPNFGLITCIGKAHLEGFGGIEGVQKGKGELFEYLEAAQGRAFVNLNDSRVSDLAYYMQKVSTYGSSRFAKIHGELVAADPFLKVRWFPQPPKKKVPSPAQITGIHTQLIGSYNLDNVLAAIAVGDHFKVPPESIKAAIESYVPTNNRSQIIEQGSTTIILDAYNANPGSMQAALKNLAGMAATRKVVILGDMLELGEYSETEHQKIVDIVEGMGVEKAVFVGSEFKKVVHNKKELLHFDTVQLLKKWFVEQDFSYTCLLIKGSRGIALEKVVLV